MARATTRRARNGWLSARLFATLAMVFATLATPGAAGGEDSFTPVPAPQLHACSCPPPNASEERPGSLGAARAERPDAGAFRTTIATFEGSRSFDEIARASYPSFASSRREGVVLRLGQPWVNPGLTCRRRAIVWTLSPPCFGCLLASASARGSVCAARLGDDDRASRRANARARVHRRAHRFKRIRTRFLSFVFVSC